MYSNPNLVRILKSIVYGIVLVFTLSVQVWLQVDCYSLLLHRTSTATAPGLSQHTGVYYLYPIAPFPLLSKYVLDYFWREKGPENTGEIFAKYAFGKVFGKGGRL